MPTPESLRDWEIEFDKKFDHKNQSKGFCDFDCANDYSIEDIKSFIRTLLASKRDEDNTTNEAMREEFEMLNSEMSFTSVKEGNIIADWWLAKLEEARKDAVEGERQFILNILDGIDIADKEMGNVRGGTKAIRLALRSRIPHSKDEK